MQRTQVAPSPLNLLTTWMVLLHAWYDDQLTISTPSTTKAFNLNFSGAYAAAKSATSLADASVTQCVRRSWPKRQG